jgi:lipopolysaccharide cholinephosphotransferase
MDITYKKIQSEECHSIYYQAIAYFDSFCESHGIHYFAMWGTLLGAIRNGGIIPWDDDVDVAMSQADLEKFLSLSKQFDNEKYQVVSYRNFKKQYTNIPRVLINGFFYSSKYEARKYDRRMAIDIFPFYPIPDSSEVISKTFAKLKKNQYLLALKFPYFGSKNRLYAFAHKILSFAFVFPTERHLHSYFNNLATSFVNCNTDFVFFPDTSYTGHNFLYRKNWFCHLHSIQFGPVHIMVPNEAEAILEVAYGSSWRVPQNRQEGCPNPLSFYVDSSAK